MEKNLDDILLPSRISGVYPTDTLLSHEAKNGDADDNANMADVVGSDCIQPTHLYTSRTIEFKNIIAKVCGW